MFYINKFGLTDIIGSVRKKKDILEILNKYNIVFYQCYSNLYKVTKIQSWFRMRIIRNRLDCNNDTDFFLIRTIN